MTESPCCPGCRSLLTIEPRHRGNTFRCKRCGQAFYVPGHDRIACEHCRAEIRIRPEYLGKTVSCRKCRGRFVAPASGTFRIRAVDDPSAPEVSAAPAPGEPGRPEEPGGVEAEALAARLAAERDDAIAEAEHLRADRDSALAEVERLRAEGEQVRSLLAEVESERSGRESRVRDLEAEVEALRGRLGDLDARSGVGAGDASRFEAMARELRATHGRWGADRRQARESAAALSAEFSRARVAWRRHFEGLRAEARALVDRLRGELARVVTERDSVLAERDQLRRALTEAGQERERLIARLSSLEAGTGPARPPAGPRAAAPSFRSASDRAHSAGSPAVAPPGDPVDWVDLALDAWEVDLAEELGRSSPSPPASSRSSPPR
ncbi:zinc ribbon domain-containing protein [Tautonia sociabilis]|uniref:Uncharacterized protein n=1 Tax=Tautonia sociabilis TaxID=2080755 RepID=A0A432MNS4_9BACT|nr:hypothetical protein [Tautonia sociabilis]RUL88728.1 hypothetical protein TsocGM_06225 [Tautonia sociabilis]